MHMFIICYCYQYLLTTTGFILTVVHGQNDIAILSRSTDFNVQISAASIHSHCSQMFGQKCKFNLSLCS